jgi:beta-xylosidase
LKIGKLLIIKQGPRAAFIAVALVLLSAIAPAQRRTNFTNPVVPGDFPDPSIIRVGQDYWAAATSSEWAPEFPLLHSRDLINWEVVGSVFRNRPEWSVGSYWAPEISHYRGRFFIYYAARKKGGPLCVAVATAASPQGPYTDHGPLICQEVGSIDPFPVNDENGQRYLLWKEDGNSVGKPTPIWAQPLSADGTRLVGERRELFHNDQAWEKHNSLPYGNLVEGPAVVRHGGWFYIFYSGNFCCARECNYMMGVARSKKLLGPWEKKADNPILRGNEAWKCPGHGTVVEDAKGRDFLLYHAYKADDFVYVGRQAMLDEIEWGTDGWPSINGGHGPSIKANLQLNALQRDSDYRFFDEFTTRSLRPGWQWPAASEPVTRIEPVRGGWLLLAPAAENSKDQPGAVLAHTTTKGDYIATTLVDTSGLAAGALAGLSAYGDGENALGVSVDARHTLYLWQREKKEQRTVGTVPNAFASPQTYLRMTARAGHLYRFAVSVDGRSWKDVGEELDGSYLPPWDRGVRVALVSGGTQNAAARFGFLRIEPTRPGR